MSKVTMEHVVAAIIGFHLSGATLEQIMIVTDTSYNTVESIIKNFKRSKEFKSL